jgi:Adenosine deaminase
MARLSKDEATSGAAVSVGNLALGLYPSVAKHPIRNLTEAGCAIVLGTDDPGFFNTDIRLEYERAEHPPLTRDVISATAIEAAFCDHETKARLEFACKAEPYPLCEATSGHTVGRDEPLMRSLRSRDLRCWHQTEILPPSPHVCCCGNTGPSWNTPRGLSLTLNGPLCLSCRDTAGMSAGEFYSKIKRSHPSVPSEKLHKIGWLTKSHLCSNCFHRKAGVRKQAFRFQD